MWDAYEFETWRPFIFPRRKARFGADNFPHYDDSWRGQDYLADDYDPDDGLMLPGKVCFS